MGILSRILKPPPRTIVLPQVAAEEEDLPTTGLSLPEGERPVYDVAPEDAPDPGGPSPLSEKLRELGLPERGVVSFPLDHDWDDPICAAFERGWWKGLEYAQQSDLSTGVSRDELAARPPDDAELEARPLSEAEMPPEGLLASVNQSISRIEELARADRAAYNELLDEHAEAICVIQGLLSGSSDEDMTRAYDFLTRVTRKAAESS